MILAVFALALAAFAASAEAATACRAPFAGELLELRCHTETFRAGAPPLETVLRADSILARQGFRTRFGLVPAPPDRAVEAALFPVLRFESNLNAGNPPGDLVLGNLVLQGDPERVRRRGLLVGAGAGLAFRTRTGEGQSALLRLEAQHGLAPGQGLSVTTFGAGACSLNNLPGWWRLDLCAGASRTERDLATETEASADAALARVFASPAGQHDASLRLRRLRTDTYGQTQIAGGLDTLAGGWFAGISLRAGEAVDDALAMRWGGTASVGRRVGAWDLGLAASGERWDGPQFLGFDRREDRFAVTATLGLGERVGLVAGYAWRRSAIDYFSIDEPFVAFRIDALRLR